MKITDVKLGTRLFNKVNGLTYKVTDVTGSKESKIAVIETIDCETTDVLDGADENYDKLEVSADNAICFRILYTPENTDIPDGYSVHDGKLLKDGETVTEQGQIFVESIIATLPGYLVIGVKPKTKADNLVDLFSYDPEKDEFKKLIRTSSIPNPKVILEQDDFVILGYSTTHIEPVLDADGKDTGEKKVIFDGAGLMFVHDKKVDGACFKRPMNLKLIPVNGSETDYLIETTYDVDENKVVSESKPLYARISIADSVISAEYLPYQPGKKVETAAVVNVAEKGIVLKGKDYILYNDLLIKSPLVEQIPGIYLVDVTYGNHEVTVTMADDEYNVASIVRKNTKDRGYIVSLA